MKILTTILLLIGINSSLHALSVNTNPTTNWNFNTTLEYWKANTTLLEGIRNKELLMSQNPNNLTAEQYYGLFILAREGNDNERPIASEKLSAFCYNRAKVAEEADALRGEFGANESVNSRIESCIKGEISPTVTAKINKYYEYLYNKKRHETIIAGQCLNIDLDDLKTENNNYAHFTKYSRSSLYGAQPTANCDEYISYKHKTLAVVTDVNATPVSWGYARGYYETYNTISARDYLQIGGEVINDGTQGDCNQWIATAARPHAQGPSEFMNIPSLYQYGWAYFFCMRDPTQDVNSKISGACTTNVKKIIGGAYSPQKHSVDELCNNWTKVGLQTSGTLFWDISRAAWMQNQLEKFQTGGYDDSLDNKKASYSNYYWGNTLSHSDITKGDYGFKGFVICPKAGSCEETRWSTSSNQLRNGTDKTSLYLKGRERAGINMWKQQNYDAGTLYSYTNSNYNTGYYELNLPREYIDTEQQTSNIVGTTQGFVSFSDNVELWLESESDWLHSSTGYNCEDKELFVHDDHKVLGKDTTTVFTQKEVETLRHGSVVAGREDSRAKKVMVTGEAGTKPYSEPVRWPYKVCNKR